MVRFFRFCSFLFIFYIRNLVFLFMRACILQNYFFFLSTFCCLSHNCWCGVHVCAMLIEKLHFFSVKKQAAMGLRKSLVCLVLHSRWFVCAMFDCFTYQTYVYTVLAACLLLLHSRLMCVHFFFYSSVLVRRSLVVSFNVCVLKVLVGFLICILCVCFFFCSSQWRMFIICAHIIFSRCNLRCVPPRISHLLVVQNETHTHLHKRQQKKNATEKFTRWS